MGKNLWSQFTIEFRIGLFFPLLHLFTDSDCVVWVTTEQLSINSCVFLCVINNKCPIFRVINVCCLLRCQAEVFVIKTTSEIENTLSYWLIARLITIVLFNDHGKFTVPVSKQASIVNICRTNNSSLIIYNH